jgi:hypothetical protein
MKLDHFAHRLQASHFDTIVDMLVTRLGFVVLRASASSVWLRQQGANVDVQFTRSATTHRDADKRGSQLSFTSATPRADLESLAAWLAERGVAAAVGSWSEREFYLDAPDAFVDFVLEAMTPDLARYPGHADKDAY